MHPLSCKVFQSLDLGPNPVVHNSGAVDEDLAFVGELFVGLEVGQMNGPSALVVVPDAFPDFRRVTDEVADVVLFVDCGEKVKKRFSTRWPLEREMRRRGTNSCQSTPRSRDCRCTSVSMRDSDRTTNSTSGRAHCKGGRETWCEIGGMGEADSEACTCYLLAAAARVAIMKKD